MASSRNTERRVKRTFKSQAAPKQAMRSNGKRSIASQPSNPAPKQSSKTNGKGTEKRRKRKRDEAPNPAADTTREPKRATRSDGAMAAVALRVDSSRESAGTGSSSNDTTKERAKAAFHPDATKAYRERWRGPPSQKTQDCSEEERLRAKFFVTSGFMPRCHTCQALREPMPKGDDRPTGNEDAECVPCGCLYDEAILEMFLVDKGIIPDKTVAQWKKKDSDLDKNRLASCAGRRKPFLMGLFEELFGDFSMAKLLDRKARVTACAQVAKGGKRKPIPVPDDDSEDDSQEQSEDDSGSESENGNNDGEENRVAGPVDGDDSESESGSESDSSFFSASD